MSKHLIIILFLVLTNFIPAQETNNTALLAQINSSKDSTSKLKLYIDLGKYYERNDQFEKAAHYYLKGLDLSTELKDTAEQLKYLFRITNVYSLMDAYDASKKTSLKGIQLASAKNDQRRVALFYNLLGQACRSEDNSKEALKYYFKATEIFQKINDKSEIPGIYNNIGLACKHLKDYPKAIENFRKSIDYANELKQEDVLSQVYNNIGLVYFAQDSLIKALSYFDLSINLARKLKDEFQEGIVLSNYGNTYSRMKDYAKAENAYKHSLDIAIKIDDLEGQLYNYSDLSNLYILHKQYEKALEYYQKYSEIKLKLEKANKNESIHRQEMKREFEKEIHEFQKAQAVKDAESRSEKEKSKLIILSTICILAVVLIFLIILINRIRIIRNQKNIIEEQKKTVDEKQKEILDSINYAKRIQYTLLAHHDFLYKNIPDNFVYFNPKDIVSGDFYWATSRPSAAGDLFYLAVCDSTGHGVPGAFMSLLNIGFLNEAINEKGISEPHLIFEFVRQRLINTISKENQKDGFDGILLRINLSTKEICYAAAHNAPVLISKSTVNELEKDKMPVGIGEKQHSFQLFSVKANAGDVLYLYTDGYADQFGGPKGKKFKYKALNELLHSISQLPMQQQEKELSSAFENWRGDLEQIDDVCVIGIRL